MSTSPYGVLVVSTEPDLWYTIQGAIDYSKVTGGGWVTVIFKGVAFTVNARTDDSRVHEMLVEYDELSRTGRRGWVRDESTTDSPS